MFYTLGVRWGAGMRGMWNEGVHHQGAAERPGLKGLTGAFGESHPQPGA